MRCLRAALALCCIGQPLSAQSPNPVSTKAIATILGLIDAPTVRLPLVEPTADEMDQMRTLLEQAGVLETVGA